MKFGEDGRLYGINPEAGFFGVAPGTSNKTNPIAVATFQKNSIFTKVGETVGGEYFWEGLEDEVKDKNVDMINWLGQKSLCAPELATIIHPDWESPKGVPIDAVIFGGRRPAGGSLVYETRSWLHGIFTGACLKSEATAAAEYKGKTVMHDRMAMRPFMRYNFGHYLQHWIDLNQEGRKVPGIHHVNWFRKDANNKFLWPGFGDNIRVIDWIIRRLDGEPDLGSASSAHAAALLEKSGHPVGFAVFDSGFSNVFEAAAAEETGSVRDEIDSEVALRELLDFLSEKHIEVVAICLDHYLTFMGKLTLIMPFVLLGTCDSSLSVANQAESLLSENFPGEKSQQAISIFALSTAKVAIDIISERHALTYAQKYDCEDSPEQRFSRLSTQCLLTLARLAPFACSDLHLSEMLDGFFKDSAIIRKLVKSDASVGTH
ncbi:phosphoenolpyruvate carboxykinase [Ancylostoma ceylanicum]|uniref:Phosphoenolpyruvate carboxykinase n=1 Tax=Ancylostoma ceylanicum TaxID=53326 RepID=A0A0D6LDU7_9BILA|nr:phosphoenolpyruvate carboxykinase [Ancylostoma ceylanicum]